jgi:hypothetical protein
MWKEKGGDRPLLHLGHSLAIDSSFLSLFSGLENIVQATADVKNDNGTGGGTEKIDIQCDRLTVMYGTAVFYFDK